MHELTANLDCLTRPGYREGTRGTLASKIDPRSVVKRPFERRALFRLSRGRHGGRDNHSGCAVEPDNADVGFCDSF